MMMFNPEEDQPGGFGGFGQLAPQLAQQFQPQPQQQNAFARLRSLVPGNMGQMRQPNSGTDLGGPAARIREQIGQGSWGGPPRTGWQPDFAQVASSMRMGGPRRNPRQRFNEGQGQGY